MMKVVAPELTSRWDDERKQNFPEKCDVVKDVVLQRVTLQSISCLSFKPELDSASFAAIEL
jgi:hypothetical protein